MIIPNIAWKREFGEKLNSPGTTKVKGEGGGLPNLDDGYFLGMPLGGIGAGTLSQTYRGDFSIWHLEIGKHVYKTLDVCQFGIFENGNALNFKNQNGTYHALYPRAYFEYKDLNIIQEQFSPIIPHNYKETSYPVAIFKWHIFNPKNEEREISLLWMWESIFGSKENIFVEENGFKGIVFNNLDADDTNKQGQMGMFIETQGDNEIFYSLFDPKGDSKEIWQTFSKNGTLTPYPPPLWGEARSTKLSGLPLTTCMGGALAAKISILPGESKVVTFVLAWDYPKMKFHDDKIWYKKYTDYFNVDGNNVSKIASETFKESNKWLSEIKAWQSEYLNLDKPDWFKSMLINELYYLAHGGTIWTTGSGQQEKVLSNSLGKTDQSFEQERRKREGLAPGAHNKEHFGMLECFDYPFYETLDVRFYGSFPLLKLFPKLEKTVLRDYIDTVNLEQNEEVFFDHPLIQRKGKRKLKGALPHDLGSPNESPFIKPNAYKHGDINFWKDLNSKFVLMIYRYFYFTSKKDRAFLESAWNALVIAIEYLSKFDRDSDGLIENDNLPDQTYDNWIMYGPSTYCNLLWLCALSAMIEIAKILNKDHAKYKNLFDLGKKSIEEKLWNGNYFAFDTLSDSKDTLMADALCGQWHADLLGLGDLVDSKYVDSTLKNIFKLNVMQIKDGKIGAINGINFNGSMLPTSQAWPLNTQSNEVWTGVTLALSSHMELRGLKKESLKTAYGIYKVVYEDKGYWFRTPEAWDINGNFRASMYHRPGAIWAFTL